MTDINQLIKEVVEFRDARNWAEAHSPENVAKSISIEAAELLELFQWESPTREEIKENTVLHTRLSEELADILIYCLSFAERTGIDPAEAIREKLKKNEIKYPLEDCKLPHI